MLEPSDYRPGDEKLRGSPFYEDDEEDAAALLEEECRWKAVSEAQRDAYSIAWWLNSKAITAESAGSFSDFLDEQVDDVSICSADRLLVTLLNPMTGDRMRSMCAFELYQRYMAAHQAEIETRANELYRQECQ